MNTQLQLILTPEQAEVNELLTEQVAKRLGVNPEQITKIRTLRSEEHTSELQSQR